MNAGHNWDMTRTRTEKLIPGNVVRLAFGRLDRTILEVHVLNTTAPAHARWVDIVSTDHTGCQYVGRFRADESWTVIA